MTLNGQQILKLTDTVTWFMQLLDSEGAGGMDAKAAQGLYGFLSNSTHPTLYTIRARRRYEPDAGHIGTVQRVDQAYLENLSPLAVNSVFNALWSVHMYCGWEFDPDRESADLIIDTTLPGSLARNTKGTRWPISAASNAKVPLFQHDWTIAPRTPIDLYTDDLQLVDRSSPGTGALPSKTAGVTE